ncbi:GH3 auxin-responsive promoter family protein [Methanobrevibacter sp. DSM 116169]|uniref:GH3 auxin-responsive promoter family protein n=1 Tax=Methanobrevibacter sp. DSM 116169 TaxID=3242727 RepID=UPI0038FC17D8
MNNSKLTPAGEKNIGRIKDGKVIYDNLIEMTKNPMKYNEELLMKILDDNKDTEYGKKYDFDNIKSIEDYQKKVPITEYDDYREYVERMSEDNEKNLITVYEIDHYAKSSATLGEPKKIPFSLPAQKVLTDYINNQAYYILWKELGDNWVNKKTFNLLEMALEKLKHGETFGALSVKFMFQYKDYIELFFISPYESFFSSQKTNKRYLHARYALMNKDMSIVQATFFNLYLDVLRYIENNWELLVKDIGTGTIDESIRLTDEEKESLKDKIKPMPERAEELKKIFEEGFESPIIPRLWPELEVIVGIGTGGFSMYTQKIKEKYSGENLNFCFVGLIASEGTFSFPLEINSEKASLLPNSVFYEFIPIDTEDLNKCITLDKLEEGKKYEIVITNLSGFYRYRMRDIVKVNGKHNEMPLIEFVCRSNQYADICGEKTSEYVMRKSLRETELQLGFDLYEYFMIPDDEKFPYRYIFFIEASNIPKDLTLDDVRYSIEENLSKNNPYFKEKMKENFDKIKIKSLKPEDFMSYRDFIISNGISSTQLKPPRIIINESHREFFKSMLN